MAIEPYRQRIGVPNPEPVNPTVATNVTDIGGSIQRLGGALIQAFEPQVLADLELRVRKDAGEFVFQRNENGELVLPPPAEDGGLRYRQAFNELIETRYLNEVGASYQRFLDGEIAARAVGEKPYDPVDFKQAVDAHTIGMLDGMDPRVRVQAEQLFAREAQERVRAFTNEWGRTRRAQTINGSIDLIRTHFQSIANWNDLGLTPEDVQAKHVAPVKELIDRLKNMSAMGDLEADALFMQRDQLTDGVQRWVEGAKFLAGFLPHVGGMGEEQLMLLEMWTRQIPAEGGLDGFVSRFNGASEVVTPDLLASATEQLFGVKPTSTIRADDHPLSQANPRSFHKASNGGRAVDMPRIPGKTIEDAVAMFKAAGFEVLEFRDEYKDPSGHATGGHWHFGFGNRRGILEVQEVEEIKGIDFATVSQLDPSIRNNLLGIINDRRQRLREEASERAAEIRLQRQLQQDRENTQRIIDNHAGAVSAGIGGDWDAETRGVLDRSFRATFDPATYGQPETRQRIQAWVQQNQYLPDTVIQYMTNGIRSDNWAAALGMYRSLEDATIGQGARVGDLLLDNLDSRTASLLMEADRMERSGQSAQIGARLERLRSGDGFTIEQAKTAYSATGEDRSYARDRNKLLRDTFGYSDDTAIDVQLMRDFDSAFASNLDVADRNVDKAMRYALRQVGKRMTSSPVFTNGVGPAVLRNTYTNQQLLEFFTKETRQDGTPLIQGIKRKSIGGTNSSIKLQPVDSETRTIGRYMVIVRNPENPSQVVDSFELDLGRELREYFSKKGQGVQVDPIAEARRNRAATQQNLINIGRSADRSPKY